MRQQVRRRSYSVEERFLISTCNSTGKSCSMLFATIIDMSSQHENISIPFAIDNETRNVSKEIDDENYEELNRLVDNRSD
jgi:hypothetical protein